MAAGPSRGRVLSRSQACRAFRHPNAPRPNPLDRQICEGRGEIAGHKKTGVDSLARPVYYAA
jgi:hypothetical protein